MERAGEQANKNINWLIERGQVNKAAGKACSRLSKQTNTLVN